MLTRDQVKKKAGYSYDRGTALYSQNKVSSFLSEEEGRYHRIQARVKGSGRKSYEVEILVDDGADSITESYCECPAFLSYNGLCKHCVAVLLEYISRTNHQRAIRDYVRQLEEIRRESAFGKGTVPRERASANAAASSPLLDGEDRAEKVPDAENAEVPGAAVWEELTSSLTSGFGRMAESVPMKESMPGKRRTTPGMAELLKRQALRQTLPVLQSATFGKVRLEPILTCDSRECSLEFRIGVNKMYVLRDVLQFAEDVRAHNEVSYGKNLQFVHTEESFAADSRELVLFLMEWAQRYQQQYARPSCSFAGRYYEPVLPKIRTISLDRWGMDAFLEAVGERSFVANVNGGGEKQWRCSEETMMPRKLTLTGRNEGIELELQRVFGMEGQENYIYFREQKVYRVPRKMTEPVRDFLEFMNSQADRTAFLEKEYAPVFYRQMLPALQQCFECETVNILEEDLGIVPVIFRFYLDMPQQDFITCKAIAVYGEQEYSVYDSRRDLEKRDLFKESEVSKITAEYCNAFDESQQCMVISGDEELMYSILTGGVENMQRLGEVYISDALRKVKIAQPPKVSVGISLTGDLLNLSVSAEDMPRDQLLEILSRYDRRRKFYRLRDGSFIRMEDNELEPIYNLREALQLTDKQLNQDVIEVPRYRTMYLDEELQAGYHLSVHKDRNFRALIRSMKTVEDTDFEVPESLNGVMREYQKYGYRWIRTLFHNGFGGILADDMGLGKTLQVICFLLSEMENRETGRRCLIVCPASLVYNWKSELERFAPVLSAKMVIGNAAEREWILGQSGECEILITSYDLLRRDAEHYEKLHFFCQIIDEAQYIKNHSIQAAKAVKNIRAGFKLALTGTPVENRLSELWSIFDYLMPGYLYGYQRFREELEQPIVQQNEEAAALRLQKMIRPFVLRRLKQDVLKDLPEKLEENMYASMEGEQQELYDAHVKRMQLMLDKKSEDEFKSTKLQVLAELTKLRQLCCDPALLYENYRGGSAKQEMAVSLIRNAVENGHKVLLFSQFTTMLDRLAESLRAENIAYYMLNGATPKEKRAQMVESFAWDAVPVFCISLKAGGTGLNLTAADVVIHFDPWWNVAVQNQATDRAHRIGQTNVVNVYRLIAKGTIEEKIVDLQERKTELADRILGGEGVGSGSLTKEELMELLR